MTAAELRAKASQLKTRIHALTAERDRLSPTAINGDARGPSARERIAAIDAERAGYISELETIEAALRSPEYRPQSPFEAKLDRIEAAYLHKKPKHQRNYAGRVQFEQTEAARYINLCLGDRENRLQQAQGLVEEVATLRERVAADICGVVRVREELQGARAGNAIWGDNPANGNPGKIERLEAELAVRERHARDLVSTTELPPQPLELTHAIALVRVRLDNLKGSMPNAARFVGPGFVGPQSVG
jgi:hypothetical protein